MKRYNLLIGILLASMMLPVILTSQESRAVEPSFQNMDPPIFDLRANSKHGLLHYDMQSKVVIDLNYRTEEANTSIQLAGSRPDFLSTKKRFSDDPTKNLGPLEPIGNPTAYPFSMNVKLFVYKGPYRFECSGSMIDSRHVLTAAHCVFDNSIADSVLIVPAYYKDIPNNKTVRPFGAALSSAIYIWTGWINHKDKEWDMAVIVFDRPMGAMTGWFGVEANETVNFYNTNTFFNLSYPDEPPYDGTQMFGRGVWLSHFYSYVYPPGRDSLYLYHNDRSYGGQSGSSYFVNWPDGEYVYAVLSHRPPNYPSRTVLAYIHHNQFNDIVNIFSENLPEGPDLIPLALVVDPDTVVGGHQLQSLDFTVHNYGRQPFTGMVAAGVYLSTDKLITNADIQIGSISTGQTSIGSKKTSRGGIVGFQPTIPASLLPGKYYVGLILEAADFDLSNNATGIWDIDSLVVIPDDKPTLGLYSQNRFTRIPGPYLMVQSEPNGSSSLAKICADGSTETTLLKVFGLCNNLNDYSLVIKEDQQGTYPERFGSLKSTTDNLCERNWYWEHPTGIYDERGIPTNEKYKVLHLQVIKNSDGSTVVEMPIHLYRAPVVMVHGIWSSGMTFTAIDDALKHGNQDIIPLWEDELTHRVDYHNTNAHWFNSNRDVVYNGVEEAISQAFLAGYSVSRVNIVGHSMGGLLARMYLQSADFDNDICRLITINTPHSGTQAADYLLGNECAKDWMNFIGNSVELGAVEDLGHNSNALWGPTGLNKSPKAVPVHAIGTHESPYYNDWRASVLYNIIRLCQPTFNPYDFVSQNVFQTDEHDLIVPLESQLGGLSGLRAFSLPFEWHLSLDRDVIIMQVNTVLNADPTGLYYSPNGFQPQRLPQVRFAAGQPDQLDGEVRIVSPIAGSEFLAGTAINIAVQGDGSVENSWLFTTNASSRSYFDIIEGQDANLSYEIPASAIGPLKLTAIGMNNEGFVNRDTTWVNIITDAKVDSIATDLQTLYVTVGSLSKVSTVAFFDDGVKRNITELPEIDYDLGNPMLASLHPNGLLKGLVPGTTELAITYQEFIKIIDVVILPRTLDRDLQLLLLNQNDVSCHGLANGSISVGGDGGIPPYSYHWSNGGKGPIQHNLSKGEYKVTVTDAIGASAEINMEIQEPSEISIRIENLVSASNLEDNGLIDISIEGVTENDYQVEWFFNDEFLSDEEDLNGLSNGSYLVKITDIQGCYLEQTIELGNTTPTTDLDLISGISIVPNPTFGELQLVFSGVVQEEIMINFYGSNGQQILQYHLDAGTSSPISLDISVLPAAVYLVRIRIGQTISWQKVVRFD